MILLRKYIQEKKMIFSKICSDESSGHVSLCTLGHCCHRAWFFYLGLFTVMVQFVEDETQLFQVCSALKEYD